MGQLSWGAGPPMGHPWTLMGAYVVPWNSHGPPSGSLGGPLATDGAPGKLFGCFVGSNE